MNFFNQKPKNHGIQLEFVEKQINQVQSQIETLNRILNKWQTQKENLIKEMQNQ
jgi:prefoldin subunit 5